MGRSRTTARAAAAHLRQFVDAAMARARAAPLFVIVLAAAAMCIIAAQPALPNLVRPLARAHLPCVGCVVSPGSRRPTPLRAQTAPPPPAQPSPPSPRGRPPRPPAPPSGTPEELEREREERREAGMVPGAQGTISLAERQRARPAVLTAPVRAKRIAASRRAARLLALAECASTHAPDALSDVVCFVYLFYTDAAEGAACARRI